MLIDETNEELLDRIESIIYILGERMDPQVLRDLLYVTVAKAIDDVEEEEGRP